MTSRRRSRWAVLVTAVVGIAAGVTTALVVPSPTPADADPLNLGVALVDLACDGQSVLVVGWGDSRAPLAVAVSDNGDRVRYLRTDASCRTLYAPVEGGVPEYVAYLGPYATTTSPCTQRMDISHRGDLVTRLRSGNELFVKCTCELDPRVMPVLREGMQSTPQDEVWVRALQGMLVDLDAASGNRFLETDVTGLYDARTVTRIKRIQETAGLRPGGAATGVVDSLTWGALRDRVCGTYDY